jgi:membrane associated rhomboid family serine protease
MMTRFGDVNIPLGVRYLLIATVGVWIVQLIPWIGPRITAWGELVPDMAIAHGQVWRFVTYMFLHASPMPFHLAFNMLALWMFGVEIEECWGTKHFVWFYVISGIGAGLFSVMMWHAHIIGASGALLALLTVYAVYFPDRTLLMFLIFPLPCRIAVAIIGVISIVGAATGSGGIAYLTHLGGIIVGLLYAKLYPAVSAWIQRGTVWNSSAPNVLPFRKRDMPYESKKEFFEREIDPILKKISEKGIDSLTKEERRKLEQAS